MRCDKVKVVENGVKKEEVKPEIDECDEEESPFGDMGF